MNTRIILIALVSAGIGALIGVFGFIWTVGGSATPSTDISAPTLDANAIPTQSVDTLMTEVANANAEVAALQTQVSDLQSGNMSDTTSPEEPTQTDADEQTEGEVLSGRKQYRIEQEDSRVTFMLMETLLGRRTEVIGGTDQVAGDVVIDFDNPAQSQVGTIRINARTLETDNENRNRALRSEILRSSNDDFEFIDFAPTQLNNLPESVVIGGTYTVDIVGDLTILNTTNSVTFATTITIDSETSISGTAETTILYADWGISIPDAIGVADVTDEVTLTIDFEAEEVQE